MKQILKLTIKKKWFDMILSGHKKTEYRDLKPFWVSRLFEYKECGNATPESFLQALLTKEYPMYLYLKRYTHVQFFNGGYYSDKLPNFTVKFQGCQAGAGVLDWGAERGKEYLCIYLGEITERNNC